MSGAGRKLGIVIAAVMLGGCESQEEIAAAKEKVQSGLPPGCILRDLGSYRDIDRLVVVTCDKLQTQTTNIKWTRYVLVGKTVVPQPKYAAAVTIQHAEPPQ